ncbi:HlyD family efflux transporter periplasmic adaptor subunit [Microbulbifer bruguierae]|uniref:HlyD family efflux transporter periplasmic adaptor subunit n=1 Tax=Microbulbifer bruguierae TaxID=3029061 RepID=A0ABY8NFG9_9GAMM|nr:HlyD family efflux transporter periplasmic adaptor subunit [Microbulbifer bruguierae]WGL17548.1 HlyD family efflux transporter periplasmic adaptor subunit [Microbulbifer bruguierae]
MEWQEDRLHGDVLLSPQLSHIIILGGIILWVTATIVWLSTCQYARKETVTGWIEPTSGVVRVYAEGTGIIEQVLVSEGEKVVKNQPLIILNRDHILADGKHLEAVLQAEYENQNSLLSEQIERSEKINQQRQRDLKQRISASKEELALLDKQISTQARHHGLIRDQAERYNQLRKRGHISTVELERVVIQELELSTESQSLARNKVKIRNQIQQLENELASLPEVYANETDQLRARLSDLAQKIAQLHGQRAYILKASKAGTVHNLQTREGQQVQIDIPLLSVVPESGDWIARLLVPVRAAGFLAPEQALKIRYDAFPYQKFGLYQGAITSISDSALLPDELRDAPIAVGEPVYRVSAVLARPSIKAYGQEFSLKPGMTLSADIELSERSLLMWLLDPIYSLKGRL